MADDAEDVGLGAIGVEGVTHRLAIEGQAFVLGGHLRIPALQRPIEGLGIDAGEHIADTGAAGDLVATVAITAAKAGAGGLAEVLRPGGNGQHHRQGLKPPLGAALITSNASHGPCQVATYQSVWPIADQSRGERFRPVLLAPPVDFTRAQGGEAVDFTRAKVAPGRFHSRDPVDFTRGAQKISHSSADSCSKCLVTTTPINVEVLHLILDYAHNKPKVRTGPGTTRGSRRRCGCHAHTHRGRFLSDAPFLVRGQRAAFPESAIVMQPVAVPVK